MSLEKSGGFNPQTTGDLNLLDKNQEKVDGDYTLKFIRFDMSSEDMAKMMSGQKIFNSKGKIKLSYISDLCHTCDKK